MRNSIRIWEAPGELHSNLEASEGTKEDQWLKRNFLLIMRNFFNHFWDFPWEFWKSQPQKMVKEGSS
jgi:hypothetical protein